ncbi:cell envelope biogenesis protein OmpA [Pseudofulvibacter geojedonensis]|uniref:Cell envelope biogenesis protein OmpA n=1 Tax=Pseudofulvibacter geojedonensis TaxID=1123758 RepID=A0ABW3I0N7_9FLAO
MSQDQKLRKLKELLLHEDRDTIDALKAKIKELETVIEEQKKLAKKVDPIIDKKLEKYTHDIPEKLGPTITQSLKNEIANSKDQVVDALYPIIGKMIKKYIQQEFKILSEKINNQLQKSFSFKNWTRKFKSKVSGVDEESLILNELGSTEIQEIFIIEKDSGILKANFSKTNTIDKDVLSGMLTAIKSFVEEAFMTGNENLEAIEYGLYNIHIQNFNSYYIAVVIHGVFNSSFKGKLEYELLNFAEKNLVKQQNQETLSKKLADTFKNDII